MKRDKLYKNALRTFVYSDSLEKAEKAKAGGETRTSLHFSFLGHRTQNLLRIRLIWYREDTHEKKVALIFEFFRECVYIMHTNKKSKVMATTIRTNSKNYFFKIQKYLTNKRIFFTSTIDNEVYTIIIFDLSSSQTDSLIQKMTKHFHLSPKQRNPIAIAA